MEKKHLFLLPVFMLVLVGVFAFGFSMNSSPDGVKQGIDYYGMVCTQVERADGTLEPQICDSNVLYNLGAEALEDYLADGTGGNDAFDWIELGNGSLETGTPDAGQTEAYTATTSCGLGKVAGVVYDNGNGNWSVGYSFTNTCDVAITNVTRLLNDDDDTLAGNTMTTVTLAPADRLNLNWTIWIV